MMSMFVCFLLGVLSQVFISQVHPIWLAGMVLFFVLLMTMNLSFSVGPLFAICSFMVLVGGVLVVFGYSVSLVPVEIDQNSKFLGSSSEDVVKMSFCFIFLILFLVSSKDYYFCSFFFSDCLYFGSSWSVVVAMLGFYLLLGMVAAVRVCSVYKGALIC